MLEMRRSYPSSGYTILFLILLIIAIFITIYDIKFSKIISKFQKTVINTKDQINISSNNYIHVKLSLKSNKAICQFNDNLIIYILSTVTNFKRRKIIRSTWATPLTGTCFVFIVGQTKNSNEIQLILNNEQRQFNDIVQIDHIESYANVIYKELAALKWSYHFYPFIPYLFKTDDDLILDSILISSIAKILVTNLVNDTSYISKYHPKLTQNLLLSDRSTFFRGGWLMDNQPTLREGKFHISEYIWPYSVLPLYCSGFGWFMSKQIRNKLLDASFKYPVNKIVWVGDVFLSGFLAQLAHVKCTHISLDYEQTLSGNCSCLMIQQPMLTVCSSSLHGGDLHDEKEKYQEYEKAWKVIQQRHNLINRTITDITDC
ncbi:unnamed protein product [Rotaria sordida]|uniref:Hexosyltransferase n=1 Tax=Rotaria sordida TaxID=392033 RepID=A0A818N6Z5_9BILA|nr:unnamed protein product [Rotaria sordida]CAF3600293.1 unnamed protein product [Rotaria sordida]